MLKALKINLGIQKGENYDCLGFQFNMWKRDKSTRYPLAAN